MRYTVHYDQEHSVVEPLPAGTKRTDGQTFAEAKKELLAFFRTRKDAFHGAVLKLRPVQVSDLAKKIEP